MPSGSMDMCGVTLELRLLCRDEIAFFEFVRSAHASRQLDLLVVEAAVLIFPIFECSIRETVVRA